MTDPTTIATAFSSVKAALELAKTLKDGFKSLEEAETKLKLAELVSSLADAKLEIANIQDTLLEKDSEIRRLHNKLEIRASLKWIAPAYYLVDEAENRQEGPYCQQCLDSDDKLIRLQTKDSKGLWKCAT